MLLVLLDNIFMKCVMGLLPKNPSFRSSTSEHCEMQTAYLIIQVLALRLPKII